jgi:ABC-type transport system involved in multi-copper enzyme maturation permease subunit
MMAVFLVTLKEFLRKRVFIMALVLTLIYLGFYSVGLYFTHKHATADILIRATITAQFFSIGLYFANFIIAFLTIMTAVGSISSEIENGTLHAILAKPIHRRDVVLGKYFGYASMLMVYSAALFLCILGLNLIFSRGQLPGVSLASSLPALALFCFQSLLILAVTMLGTTLFGTLSNGVFMVMLYATGMVGGFLEQIGNLMQNQNLINMGIISSFVMPADAIYRKAVFTLFNTDTSSVGIILNNVMGGMAQPSGMMMVYTVLYVLFVLWSAIRIFNRRDI